MGGWLSGKHSKTSATEGSRVAWAEKVGWKPTSFSGKDMDQTRKILNTVDQITKENGQTTAQVSLR